MKEPTKADLAAAVARLTEENAGLRDLLAAVSEYARSVPQAVFGDSRKEHDRASATLIRLGVITDPDGTWTWGWASGEGAARLREHAAEPVGYEVHAEAPPVITAANPPHHAGPREEMCLAEDAGYMCSSQKGHDGPLHVAWKVEAEGTWYHRWPVTVADAARTEPQQVAS